MTEVLNTLEAAQYLRLGKATLERWRGTGEGPPFIRLGGVVRYRRADLESWLTECTFDPVQPVGRRGAP